MCKISIITPVYNVEGYLEKCIDSILNQTFSDFELIIVDDGSPDLCGTIADQYALKDKRIKVIHKDNGGAPSARNAGIEQATGDYFYFPDSDDWLEPDYLECLYKIACTTGVQLVISGYVMEYCEKKKNMSFTVLPKEKIFDSKEKVRHNVHLYFDNMMVAVPWNKLYRADYIKEKNLRFPNLKWDDLHFNMEVIKELDSFAVSPATGYHFFRSRAGSETTHVFDEMLYEKRTEQFKHILSVYKFWKIKDKEIYSTLYGYYASRLIQCIQEISISDKTMAYRKNAIKNILDKELSKKAFAYGKIESKLLRISAIPARCNNVTISFWVGKIIGFVKLHFSTVFYYLKSTSVNNAI